MLKFNTFSILLLYITGLVYGDDVTQTPRLWKRKGEAATMDCSHTKGSSYYQMYWYRQLPGDGMKQIVYTATGGDFDYGDFSKDKFNAVKTVAESGSFTVKKLVPEDNGVYFCAVSRGQGASQSQAYFGHGTKLTVLEPGLNIKIPTVKVLRPSKKECNQKKKKKTLVCVATDFYPDHVTVTWKKNGKVVTKGVATDEMALRDGPGSLYSITSRLGVSAIDWFTKSSRFTCTVSFYNGSATEDVSDETQGQEGFGMSIEAFMKSAQTVKLSYGILIAKSSLYGLFVMALVWKFKGSSAKGFN